ncbi:helix-turn-helix domain-containing protein [Paenibacillus soyae]|uniref:Helix-turn-helix domain-containing protein n=1 Tax=Paenibacillus soyae TaxID=2969249 RepID=A0A9X2MPD3_9BACL|nr:helix-turn-helix domain-containing protein [Paenibacillus soyae]MCR2803985.1 hypothetical protein [Paenibacillus soyae]
MVKMPREELLAFKLTVAPKLDSIINIQDTAVAVEEMKKQLSFEDMYRLLQVTHEFTTNMAANIYPFQTSQPVEGMAEALIQLEERGKDYSTSQLAELFSVSQTTINNWIQSGRLAYKRKHENEHAQIPETTRWRSSTGEWRTIKEVADAVNMQTDHSEPSIEERIKAIETTIEGMRNRYGGTYEELFEGKETTSLKMERIRQAWQTLNEELEELRSEQRV